LKGSGEMSRKPIILGPLTPNGVTYPDEASHAWVPPVLHCIAQFTQFVRDNKLPAHSTYALHVQAGRLHTTRRGDKVFRPGLPNGEWLDRIESFLSRCGEWTSSEKKHQEHEFTYTVAGETFCTLGRQMVYGVDGGSNSGGGDGGKVEEGETIPDSGADISDDDIFMDKDRAECDKDSRSLWTVTHVKSNPLFHFDAILPVHVPATDKSCSAPLLFRFSLCVTSVVPASTIPAVVRHHEIDKVRIYQCSSFTLRHHWQYRVAKYWSGKSRTSVGQRMNTDPTFDIRMTVADVSHVLEEKGYDNNMFARSFACKMFDALFVNRFTMRQGLMFSHTEVELAARMKRASVRAGKAPAEVPEEEQSFYSLYG